MGRDGGAAPSTTTSRKARGIRSLSADVGGFLVARRDGSRSGTRCHPSRGLTGPEESAISAPAGVRTSDVLGPGLDVAATQRDPRPEEDDRHVASFVLTDEPILSSAARSGAAAAAVAVRGRTR